jgi:hypothetical protein
MKRRKDADNSAKFIAYFLLGYAVLTRSLESIYLLLAVFALLTFLGLIIMGVDYVKKSIWQNPPA